MKTRTIVILAVPVIILGLALTMGSSLLLRLSFISILIPLASYLWTVVGIRGISAQAEKPPEHCQVGDQFQQEITVFNDSRLPKLWLRLQDNNDMPGPHSTRMVNMRPRSFHRWQADAYCQRRGRFKVGSVLATAADPFGLFLQGRTTGKPHSVIVYPATFDLPLFKLTSFNEFGYSTGQRSLSQISPNASSVREFVPGDSLHHIHWRSTARTGKLMVKVFDADRSYNTPKTVWVVLDMEKGIHCGKGEETTEEYGVTIAASLARKYIESGVLLGLMTFGDKGYLFPPEREEGHLWRILEVLAVLRANGSKKVGQLIAERMEYLGGNSIVIIVTPSTSEDLVNAIRHLRNQVDSVVAILLDLTSFGGKTSPVNTAHNLSATGVQVYLVQQGNDLSKVLDNRLSLLNTRYMQSRVS